MKTVYSNSYDVIHLFANLTDEERFSRDARCSNVFFEDGVLYSYGRHFALARYVQTKKHGLVVLLNTDSYSVTTSKHQSQTRSALSHRNIIRVPGAESNPGFVFEAFASEAKPHLDKLAKARKPEKYISDLNYLLSNAERYAEVIGVKVPKSLRALLEIKDGEKYAEAVKIEAAKKLAKQKRDVQKGLKQWRAFEPVTVRVSDPNGYSYLRINREEKRIETTQHIKMGYCYARQFWQMIEYGKQGNDFQTLIGFPVLDRFEVREFNAKYISIGCHKIALSEIDSIAKQMNWQMPETPVEVEAITECETNV